tara:strand:+ start:684 stop:2483 length:1800 start_codon:yes stop_codon:yes gene_type:complete
MAGYSARQSSFTTGDTILAAHSNDEFNQVLAAFNATTGHSHDGTAGEGGPVTTLRDADSLNKILVDTSNNHLEFYVEVSSAAVQQLRIQDGAIVPITDNDIDLGTSSLEFKDLFIDGTANVDAINLDGTLITSTAAELNILDGVTATAAELNILDGVTSTAAELNILDGVTATAAELNIMDGVTSTTAELNILDGVTSTASELNLVDGITAGTVSASKAVIVDSNKDLTGLRNLTISGDLTVSGDDITMGTNTSGNLLIADGTNFNSVAVGDLSEISTVANDDVFLAIDTSGGGLKKIARSAVVSGLATSGAISNVVEDTTPQLGGNLDVNGQDIVTTSNADIELAPNGTGKVVIKGNTNQGKIVLNCEANSHGQTIIAAPHSESANNVLTLPSTGGDARLVSATSTATLTNKTLTTPVIAEIDSGSSITLDATTDIVLDAGGADVTLKDDGTTFGSLTNSSGELVIKSGSTPTTAMTFSGANVTFAGTVTIGSAGISEAELEILDGATVTTDELNILDGVTSTAAELNILDGVTSTAAEINVIDGDTSATSTTLADADRLVTNDAGTMKQVALTDVKTYLTSAGFSTDDPTALAIALG